MIATPTPDKITKRWIRDASDELAAASGCWFDEGRGQFVVDWLRDYLRLYEGEAAGQAFECRDWQYEATMRLFGWVYKSEDWERVVRRFKKASIWVAKKNKKSPTMAAWTIYHACADGVMGQKCFPTAVDGRQIRENVALHIHEMIRQSEELSAECKLNQSTMSVFHEPTRSIIMPLSSDNVRTQKAKEGLNGSVFVDETHVVDKAHMRRLSRAGISRPEPLQIEASTAGDEPDSYGMGRFKYAQGVADGTHKDIHTLAIIHAAPQDVSDEDIHADPLKYGKMANPAMGHTVKQSEFLSDYTESKRTLSGFADFKKYRLNIWQQSSSPWLSIHDWRSCNASAVGLDCEAVTFAGMDLSQRIDFTAWVLYQPETKKSWGHYWCPMKRALELSSQFELPILDWAKQGWVTLDENGSIPRRLIHDRIAEDAKRYRRLKYVGYDRALIGDTMEFIANEGLEPIPMAQGVMTLNAPSVELADMVVNHEFDHSYDPVLDWMIQNVSVKPDTNGNIKPLKNEGNIRRHIDGVVALVMAICASMSTEPTKPSIYEQPGMLAL